MREAQAAAIIKMHMCRITYMPNSFLVRKSNNYYFMNKIDFSENFIGTFLTKSGYGEEEQKISIPTFYSMK